MIKMYTDKIFIYNDLSQCEIKKLKPLGEMQILTANLLKV